MTTIRTLILVALAAAATGCATVQGPGGTMQRHFMLQRGIILQVVHACSEKALVYQAGRGFVGEIIGATPRNFPMVPAMMGERQIHVTVQSLDASGDILGVYSQTFWIDQNTTTSQNWMIVSGNLGGGGMGARSQCPR